jgi:hypothetical protein
MVTGGLGGPENVPGGKRMNDLCALVCRGIRSFSTKTFVYFGLYSTFFFLLILIVFSPMEYYDRLSLYGVYDAMFQHDTMFCTSSCTPRPPVAVN